MSDVDGIYNKPPWEDGARMMHTYTSQDRNTIEFGKKSKVRIHCLQTIHIGQWIQFSFVSLSLSMESNEQYVRYVYSHTDIKVFTNIFSSFSFVPFLFTPYNKNK